MAERIYLDWNATAPLRPEARAAMLQAMDAIGNPSSQHAEGRAARAIVERARAQLAALVGCDEEEATFTSGATEAMMMSAPHGPAAIWPVEHESVWRHLGGDIKGDYRLDDQGRAVTPLDPQGRALSPSVDLLAMTAANGETGVLQPVNDVSQARLEAGGGAWLLCDITQVAGRIPFRFADWPNCFAILSAHKLGGPKGVGAMISSGGALGSAYKYWGAQGWGQEKRRRPGTENVIGIAGFGAACAAAARDLQDGVWERVRELRDHWESALRAAAPEAIIFSENAPRLPNTSCFAIPGWKGETQVMQLDLQGVAISAGAACSSGKAEPSRMIMAMGHDEDMARCAVRVSLGWTTTRDEIDRFIDIWTRLYARRKARAA